MGEERGVCACDQCSITHLGIRAAGQTFQMGTRSCKAESGNGGQRDGHEIPGAVADEILGFIIRGVARRLREVILPQFYCNTGETDRSSEVGLSFKEKDSIIPVLILS